MAGPLPGDLATGEERTVEGHVELRWSHGRFGGPPEAKVYLDTPHDEVPGYHRLDEPEPVDRPDAPRLRATTEPLTLFAR